MFWTDGDLATMNSSGLTPVEFYVVVELDPVEEKTAGGIILPATVKDKNEISAQEGTLVAVSPHAFDYATWPDDQGPPEPGNRVLFKRYDGHLHERGGKTFKLLNDKSIIAVIEPAAAAVEEAA